MDSRTFGAFTRADGQLQLDDRPTFVAWIKSLPPGSRLTITVAPEQDVRSLAQNARFWKICELAAEAWSVGRPLPIHKEEAKLALCRAFLGLIETPLGLVPRGTRGLTTGEMSALQERITAHFAAEGTPLPLDRVD